MDVTFNQDLKMKINMKKTKVPVCGRISMTKIHINKAMRKTN